MTYFYVLTLQLPGFDPVTYKGTCEMSSGSTQSDLFDFVVDTFLSELGRPNQTQYSILYWYAAPNALEPVSGIGEARR